MKSFSHIYTLTHMPEKSPYQTQDKASSKGLFLRQEKNDSERRTKKEEKLRGKRKQKFI